MSKPDSEYELFESLYPGTLTFKASPEVTAQIELILDRAAFLFELHNVEFDKHDRDDLDMCIRAAHLNDCPLDLARWFKADTFDFAHDVCEIRNHTDRHTGRLTDCFVPRFALPEAARVG